MNFRISRHQIGKYKLGNGHCIDAFIVGDPTGYKSVVPINISDSSSLDVVNLKIVRGKPVLTQVDKWTYTPWIINRFTCYDKSKPLASGAGYGTIYVQAKDRDRVMVIANGHCTVSGRKQNEIILAMNGNVEVLFRPANGTLRNSKVMCFAAPGVASTSPPPTQAKLHFSWIDICGRDVVECFRATTKK